MAVWGVSGMTLNKLSSLFNNSLLLSPTPSSRDLFSLSSLIFCLALSLILKGSNKVGNWLCDSDLVNPTGIEQVLTEKDLLADSYSNLEASILDEKEFLLLKVISTLLELSCLICSMVGAGQGIDDVALSMTHFSGRVTSSHFMVLGRETLAFVISVTKKEHIEYPEGFLEYSSHPCFDLWLQIGLLHQRDCVLGRPRGSGYLVR
ncbi:hypothetical protein HKD37_01G001812 [Glycine soja]